VFTQTFTLGATAQLSATESNDLRLGIARNKSSAYTEVGFIPFEGPFYLWNLSGALGIPNASGPNRANAFIHIPGIGDSEENSNTSNSFFRQWNFRDTFSLQASSHLFKFGIDNRHIASTLTPAALSVQADFFSPQSLVDNLASDIAVSKSTPATPVLNEFSAFAQDEWHASSALTLSMGLRWEVDPPPGGRHGLDAYTAQGSVNSPTTLSLAPRGTPLWHTGWFNLAPRFGAAWMLKNEPGGELILRAGAGVFFDTANRPALGAFSGFGFTDTSYYENVPVPATAAQLDLSNLPGPLPAHSLVFAFPSHLQLPYSTQWNVGLEKALGKNQALTISYVGAHGDRLLLEQRKNISQFNHSFGDVSFFPNGLTSNYQALQMKFQRSISPGIQALASYTWAHSLDYGSTDPLYPLTYGNSDLDVRHNLEAAISWELPKPMKSRLMKYVLGKLGSRRKAHCTNCLSSDTSRKPLLRSCYGRQVVQRSKPRTQSRALLLQSTISRRSNPQWRAKCDESRLYPPRRHGSRQRASKLCTRFQRRAGKRRFTTRDADLRTRRVTVPGRLIQRSESPQLRLHRSIPEPRPLWAGNRNAKSELWLRRFSLPTGGPSLSSSFRQDHLLEDILAFMTLAACAHSIRVGSPPIACPPTR
jgi:hypothetical protein